MAIIKQNRKGPLEGDLYYVTRIHDTRDVEYIGDKARRITGSGDARPCDRCGSPHEVHYYVAPTGNRGAHGEIHDPSIECVGSSCAKNLRGYSEAKTPKTYKVEPVTKTYTDPRTGVVTYSNDVRKLWAEVPKGDPIPPPGSPLWKGSGELYKK